MHSLLRETWCRAAGRGASHPRHPLRGVGATTAGRNVIKAAGRGGVADSSVAAGVPLTWVNTLLYSGWWSRRSITLLQIASEDAAYRWILAAWHVLANLRPPLTSCRTPNGARTVARGTF